MYIRLENYLEKVIKEGSTDSRHILLLACVLPLRGKVNKGWYYVKEQDGLPKLYTMGHTMKFIPCSVLEMLEGVKQFLHQNDTDLTDSYASVINVLIDNHYTI